MQIKSTIITEPYKGVRDFYPEDQFIQEYIFSVWNKAVQSFGFESYNASVIEPAELYKAKSGQEIVNEQTYTFIDRGEREVTLRPEMTPTVARLVAGRRRELGFPLRLYSIPNVFRYERPQRGRLREHWQLNVDMFGSKHISSDIEMIEISSHIMKSFGADTSDFIIKISSRKLLNSIFSEWYSFDEEKSHALKKLIDRKSKMPEADFYAEAEKIAGKPFSFLNFENDNPELSEAFAFPNIKSAYDELQSVVTNLKAKGITNIEFDQTLIRGFDYYTGIIFEVFDTHPENNRSLFGGGRYDDLLKLFGIDDVPACGFGMGDVTIADFLRTRNLLPTYKAAADLIVCPLSEDSLEYSSKLASKLRAKGIHTCTNNSFKNVRDLFKTAEKLKIKYCIIIGEDEVKNQQYKIKDLETGAEFNNVDEILGNILELRK